MPVVNDRARSAPEKLMPQKIDANPHPMTERQKYTEHYKMNAKMTQFMYDLNLLLDKRYDIVMNDNADEWYGARILIHADFNCNEYVVTKRGFNRRGEPAEEGEYLECRKCHCKHGCRISKEFEELIEKNGYKCDVIQGPTIGLWRK